MANHPDYQTLFQEVDLSATVEEVHNGYFSIDKKGGWTDTVESNQALGTTPMTRLQSDHAGKGKAPRLRDAAEIHLFSFRAEGGLG